MNSRRPVNDYLFAYGCPATMILIAMNVITFFTAAILQGSDPFLRLVFMGDLWPRQFWTVLTWPLVGAGHPMTLLFACLWAYWVCGSLERSWGTSTFAPFFLALAALTAICVWIGGRVLTAPVAMAGLWFAVAAPTVAWCTINRRESISVWGVITVPAPLIGWFTVLMLWYEVGQLAIGRPGYSALLGLFALIPCAIAYWYALHGRYAYRGYASNWNPFLRGRRPGRGPDLRMSTSEREAAPRRGFAPLRRFQAWQERRKLESLWKRSVSPGPDDRDKPR